jgi:hypothetical protein
MMIDTTWHEKRTSAVLLQRLFSKATLAFALLTNHLISAQFLPSYLQA